MKAVFRQLIKLAKKSPSTKTWAHHFPVAQRWSIITYYNNFSVGCCFHISVFCNPRAVWGRGWDCTVVTSQTHRCLDGSFEGKDFWIWSVFWFFHGIYRARRPFLYSNLTFYNMGGEKKKKKKGLWGRKHFEQHVLVRKNTTFLLSRSLLKE